MMRKIVTLTWNGVLMSIALFLGAFLGPHLLKTRTAEAQAPVVSPPATPSVIKASRLDLVDREGNVKASLRLSSYNEPMLFMFGDDKKVRLSMSVIDNVPGLDLEDKKGNSRLSMFVEEKRTGLEFSDGQKTPRLHLGYSETQGPLISLNDGQKKPRLDLTCQEEVGAAIFFKDEKAKVTHRLPAGSVDDLSPITRP